jgi:hypothetical protein
MTKSKRCGHCGKKLLTDKAWIEVHTADPAMPNGNYCDWGVCYAAAVEARKCQSVTRSALVSDIDPPTAPRG